MKARMLPLPRYGRPFSNVHPVRKIDAGFAAVDAAKHRPATDTCCTMSRQNRSSENSRM
jgi:hypothetical protein